MTSIEVLKTHLATTERLDDTLRAYERLLHRKTRMQRSKYHATLNSMLGACISYCISVAFDSIKCVI